MGMLSVHILVVILTFSYLASGAIVDISHYKQLLHDLHNDYRKKPASSNMKYMSWSDSLAHEAELWARGCHFVHQMKGRGENLYFNTVITEMKDMIKGSLHAWYDESRYYNYGTQSCGSACHYVQMVWAKTNQVGCAINMCDNLAAWGRYQRNAFYLVCFYSPKGNWIGEYPYLHGSACSRCDQNESCYDSLCRGREGLTTESGNREITTVSAACTDTYNQRDCPAWAERGDCSRNPGFMLPNCAKSCGTCNTAHGGLPTGSGIGQVTTVSAACTDTYSQRDCPAFAERGDCSRNPRFMLSNCAKSCGACNPGAVSDIFDTTQCQQWASIGECSRNSGWMLVNCKKSCNSQPSGTTAVAGSICRNNYGESRCEDWARNGECARNPGFMLMECKHSCNMCDNRTG